MYTCMLVNNNNNGNRHIANAEERESISKANTSMDV